MRLARIQITPWDKAENFVYNNFEIEKGDKVIVKYNNIVEYGEVVSFVEVDDERYAEGEKDMNFDETAEENAGKENSNQIKQVLRKASANDLMKLSSERDKAEAINYCKAVKEKHGLRMKFVGAHFSFEGSRITFAFIAEGRVDFRELVKDLTRHFGRTIRLQQIGIRDEAKIMGDYGHCGRELCCKKFLNSLASITSEMAEIQQCSHRGSDRISGICGRLMCCLAYEEKGYEACAAQLAPIGSEISVEGKKGIVAGHNTLKQTINVAFPDEKGEQIVVEVGEDKKIIKPEAFK